MTLIRTFTLHDQETFAKVSGDYNPMHVDPIAARRFMFGAPVVHGIHLLLWGLEEIAKDSRELIAIKKLDVSFSRPLLIHTVAELTVEASLPDRRILRIRSEGQLLARIDMELTRDLGPPCPTSNRLPPPGEPKKISIEQLLRMIDQNLSQELSLIYPLLAFSELFPNTAKRFPESQIATLLASTRLVGMECPGYNSIFSKLTLRAADITKGASLGYKVEKYDPRFGLLTMPVTSPSLIGQVCCFVRPEPSSQSSFSEIRSWVKPDSFGGQRALIVGGSRGLGEVAGKVLAAGGAEVALSYHSGSSDADRLVQELLLGETSIKAFRYNALDESAAFELRQSLGNWVPTHVYFFATPLIRPGLSNKLRRHVLHSFCDFYLGAFSDVVHEFVAFGSTHFFFPSSVYVESMPAGLIEYSLIKQAAEMLCVSLQKQYPKTTFMFPRFPKMQTDQTAELVLKDPGVRPEQLLHDTLMMFANRRTL